jgi:hypothetical protein
MRRARDAGEAVSGPGVKERVGMSKRYERYRKEYSSRQVSFPTTPSCKHPLLLIPLGVYALMQNVSGEYMWSS